MAENTVNACPNCNWSQVYEREHKSPPWRCKRCGHEFDEPLERDVVQTYKLDP